MQCQKINNLFSEYIDGMLDPSLQDAVRQHIKKCESCRSQLSELEYTAGLLRKLPLVEPPAEFRRELRLKLDRIKAQENKAGRIRRMFTGGRTRIIAAAAVFMLVIGVSYAWRSLPQMQDMQVSQVRSESYESEGYNEGKEKVDSLKGSPDTKDTTQIALSGERAANTAITPSVHDAPVADETAETQINDNGVLQESAFSSQPPDVSNDSRETTTRLSAPAEEGILKFYDGAAGTGTGAAGTDTGASGTIFQMASTPAPEDLGGDQTEKVAVKLKVNDVKAAANQILALAGENGWPVTETPETGGRELIMSIPAVQFDQATAELGKIGAVIPDKYPARSGAGKRLISPADPVDAGAEGTAEADKTEEANKTEEADKTEMITLRVRLE